MKKCLFLAILLLAIATPGHAETEGKAAAERARIVNSIKALPDRIKGLENNIKEYELKSKKMAEIIHSKLTKGPDHLERVSDHINFIEEEIEHRMELARQITRLEFELKEARSMEKILPDLLESHDKTEELIRRSEEALRR